MQRIALLGLGIMGSRMAANWLAKGFAVTVYNRTSSRATPLAELGASVAASPRAAARGAHIVFAMVADDEASRQVWLGDDGALASLTEGAIVIESSTLSLDWIHDLASRAKAMGADFLDAPVGGSKAVAQDGKLALFVGGDAAVLERARPALESISGKINHLGDIGAGATWKLLNNIMVATHVAVLAEVLVLARKAGIDLAQAADLIKNSASPIMLAKLPRMIEHRFGDRDMALKHIAKDVAYAIALAERLGSKLDMVPAAAAAYGRSVARGDGELDFAAVVDAFEG
jgi:3-hydroxyisobutyrate dehydrogenase